MRAALPLALVAVASLGLTACGSSEGGDDSGMNLASAGTLTVCSDVPYPPFEFEKGGEYTGFDMDLMREIAKGMDLKMSVKDVGFDGLQSGAALNAGTCDIGASAMTITKERAKNLSFSDPYYDSLQSLLVPKDSDIKDIKDLSGKTVGVQQGTTGEKYAKDHIPDDAEMKSYPSDAELFPALQSGGVDVVLQDLPVNLGHTEGGKFTIAQEYDTSEQYGFAVKKSGSEELLKGVNKQLKELKDDGTYDKLYDKYFSENKK